MLRITATIAPGTLGQEPLEPHDDDQGAQGEGEGLPLDRAERRERVPLLLEPVPGALGDAEHVGDLPGQHLDTDPGEEPDEHGGARGSHR